MMRYLSLRSILGLLAPCRSSRKRLASLSQRWPPAAWRVKVLVSQGVTREIVPPYFSVKEAVLPFNKFPGTDPILGPEMKSTGEVMGTGDTFAAAFARAQLGAGDEPPPLVCV